MFFSCSCVQSILYRSAQPPSDEGRGVVMSRERNRRLFVYALCLALLLTIGLRFFLTSAHIAEASPGPIHMNRSLHITAFLNGNFHSFKSYQAASPTPLAEEPPATTEVVSAEPAQTQVDETPVLAPALPAYEVTAYYLNVRTKPNASSPIMNVVKQGEKLEIVQITEEGWLEVKDGGYVHGGYAKKVEMEAPTPAAVALASIAAASARPLTVDTASEPSKPTSAVKSESGLTKSHIAQIFEGTDLAGNELEEAILEIEEEYGINAYFTIAVMKLESGNGKSSLAKNKNNLFGLNATGGSNNKAFSFQTKGDSVREFGQILNKYYTGNGYTTVEKIAKKYCPANSEWANLVSSIMKSDYKKL
ncbi:glucosaminidase domain-containing protein [Paenibacillus sp. MBLB4367]|uniref:glucosaminidase domain-containing protein n=1 Tax=Paenibacillus sp. MBLB4367 TaxID=3384767 RepID=UPI0039084098